MQVLVLAGKFGDLGAPRILTDPALPRHTAYALQSIRVQVAT